LKQVEEEADREEKEHAEAAVQRHEEEAAMKRKAMEAEAVQEKRGLPSMRLG